MDYIQYRLTRFSVSADFQATVAAAEAVYYSHWKKWRHVNGCGVGGPAESFIRVLLTSNRGNLFSAFNPFKRLSSGAWRAIAVQRSAPCSVVMSRVFLHVFRSEKKHPNYKHKKILSYLPLPSIGSLWSARYIKLLHDSKKSNWIEVTDQKHEALDLIHLMTQFNNTATVPTFDPGPMFVSSSVACLMFFWLMGRLLRVLEQTFILGNDVSACALTMRLWS